MAQEAVVSDVDRANGVHLTRRLTLGSELCCTTIQGNTFRGNLVAQDEETMLIVIKEASSDPLSSTTDNHNTHIINLRHATKLDVIFEPLAPPTSYTRLPQLDTERIRRRVETNTSSKWREVRSRGVDVSTQAQELFDYISKMYNDIEWDKDVIVVLGEVRISPPYTPENCLGSQPACNRIRKQVAKFHSELESH